MMEIIIVEHILILDVLKLLILIIIIQTTHKIIKNFTRSADYSWPFFSYQSMNENGSAKKLMEVIT